MDGGHEPGDGSDRPVHRVREHPGHRGHSQDAEAADAHQRVHRVPGERGPHHGAAGGAVRRRAGGARLVAVRLLFLRVLDLRGCPVRHRQHRDPVRHRHRQVRGHHLAFPLPEPVNQSSGQGGGVRGVGHLCARVLPAHPDALVPGQCGHGVLRRPRMLRLCHQQGIRHLLIHHIFLHSSSGHDICLRPRVQGGEKAAEEDRQVRGQVSQHLNRTDLQVQEEAVQNPGAQGAEGAQDAGHHHGDVHPVLAAFLYSQRGAGVQRRGGGQGPVRVPELARVRELSVQPHNLLPEPGLQEGFQEAAVLPEASRPPAAHQLLRPVAVLRRVRDRAGARHAGDVVGLRRLGQQRQQPGGDREAVSLRIPAVRGRHETFFFFFFEVDYKK